MKFKFLNSLNILPIFIVTGLLCNNACTRSSQDATSTSSIQFSIPAQMQGSTNGLSAQTTPPAAADLEHVVVNISGSGFNTIARTWSKKGSGIGSDNATPVFSFDILQGEGRLIQAIAVYKNADNGMDFYYGETIATLYNDNELITVTLGAVGSSTGMEGSIEGRYVTGTSTSPVYPTGTLTTVFTPPGRSPVIIAQSPMTDGWFSAFVLSGQNLDYLMNGESITGGAKQLSDFDTLATASSERILVTKIPQYYQWNGSTYDLRPAKAQIRGFFGPGATGTNYQVCYYTAGSITNLTGYCRLDSNSCATTLAYDPVGTGPTDTFVEDGQFVRVVGGVNAASASACGASTFINTWAAVGTAPTVYRFFMNPAVSAPAGFSSQIQGALNTDKTLTGSGTYTLTYSLLPGITATSYDIYAMTKDAIDFLSYDGHGGINCNKMYPELGLIIADKVVINNVTKVKLLGVSNTTSISFSTSFADVLNAKFVICPRFDNSSDPYRPGAEFYGN